MAVPIPIPDLNLNSATNSESGDIYSTKNSNFSFSAPTVNKTNYMQLALVGAAVAFGAWFILKKRG